LLPEARLKMTPERHDGLKKRKKERPLLAETGRSPGDKLSGWY
jgi:hypothetical protein